MTMMQETKYDKGTIKITATNNWNTQPRRNKRKVTRASASGRHTGSHVPRRKAHIQRVPRRRGGRSGGADGYGLRRRARKSFAKFVRARQSIART